MGQHLTNTLLVPFRVYSYQPQLKKTVRYLKPNTSFFILDSITLKFSSYVVYTLINMVQGGHC